MDIYKSTLAPAIESGMAFISVLIHKNSPHTVIIAHPITFRIHQGSVCGMWRLKIQHPRKWQKWAVTAKSKHSFALWTMYHKATALENKSNFNTWIYTEILKWMNMPQYQSQVGSHGSKTLVITQGKQFTL